eukprot:gene22064-28159_t
MNWSEKVFKPVFSGLMAHNGLSDENTEFGGNAQSITKDRWVHHTSFLWDFDPANMEYLQVPKRRPEYRKDRSHLDFITRLSSHVRSVEDFEQAIRDELAKSYILKDDIRPFTGAYEAYKKTLSENQGSFVPRSIVQPLE